MNALPAVQSIDARQEPQSGRHSSAYEKLRSALIRYEFRPGERLMIADLGSRFGVSATPIREALNRLRQEELIDFAPGQGYSCPVPDLKVLSDLHRALAHMLIFAADHVLGEPQGEDVDKIVASLEAPGQICIEPPAMASLARARLLEQAFRQFVALSENTTFLGVLDNVLARTHKLRCLMLESPEQFTAAKTALEQLRDALRHSDRELARRLILANAEAQLDLLPGMIRELVARAYTDRTVPVMSKSA